MYSGSWGGTYCSDDGGGYPLFRLKSSHAKLLALKVLRYELNLAPIQPIDIWSETDTAPSSANVMHLLSYEHEGTNLRTNLITHGYCLAPCAWLVDLELRSS